MLESLYPAASILFIVLGAVWGHSLWLSKQFSSLRELIYSKVDQLESNFIQKLEYHERHDDIRFNEVHKEVWEMKLRNASYKDFLSRQQVVKD